MPVVNCRKHIYIVTKMVSYWHFGVFAPKLTKPNFPGKLQNGLVSEQFFFKLHLFDSKCFHARTDEKECFVANINIIHQQSDAARRHLENRCLSHF